ncbi:MAG: hypothetical protein U9N14_02245, partial [Pseudomonadota bacterium]|nr:hypothetical protein [Pseudomonadota bacterium]
PELATHASRDTLETSVELKTLLLERYGLSDLKILSSEDQTSLLHAVGNTFAGWFDVLKSKGTGNEAALTAAAALRCSDMAGDDNALATGVRSFMPSTNAECNAPEHIDRLTVDAGKAQTPKELALISARVLNAGAGMKEHTSGRNVCDKARLIAGQLSISAPNADLMRRTSDALLEMSFLFRTHDGNQMLALCKDLSQRTGRTIQLLHGAKQTPSAPRA